MNRNDIRNVIEFAIRREQESIDFYEGLAARVKVEAVSEELKKMAAMEMGHRKKLEGIDIATFTPTPAEAVQDLKIADYAVNAEPSDDMSWPDIVNIAMHREMVSVKLYTDLAGVVSDVGVKALFEHVAAEEQGHKNYLETIWEEEVMKDN